MNDLRGVKRQPVPLERNEELEHEIQEALGDTVDNKDMAEAALEEARTIYDHRDARLARVETRATTLQATVGIAATLVVAAAAFLLDRSKVTDDVARYVLAGLAFVLVFSLVATGRFAAGATRKLRPRRTLTMLERLMDEQKHAPANETPEQRVVRHLRHQIEDLLLAADRSAEIDHERSHLLLRARAWYYLSLGLLVVLALAMLVFAVIMDPPPTPTQ